MNLFLELLQISVGGKAVHDSCLMTKSVTAAEWYAVLEEAERQAVVGVMFCGIEQLKENGAKCVESMPQELMLQWIGEVMQIEQQNVVTTKSCLELCRQFEKDGLKTCVLKGQANHRYYPAQMANRRNCGDIDIWVGEKNNSSVNVGKVLDYVDKHWERTGLCWLHCNFTEKDGVPVEVHFHPSFFSRPWRNRRLQKHFANIENCVKVVNVDGAGMPTMKVEEDVIYQMNHIFRHLIDEGVGLRQIVDYYFLLRYYNEHESLTIDRKLYINNTIEELGMKRFASALMYVLRELLGMPEEYLLCTASKKDGKFLKDEILMSGNFGQGDPRMADLNAAYGYLQGRMIQAWRRFKRNMRFLTSYPGEVIWEPIVRVEHFAWKKLEMWKW